MGMKKTVYIRPLILSVFIILFDQITKFLVLKFIPEYGTGEGYIKKIIGEDFLWFINISNRGAMFSAAEHSTGIMRAIVLFIAPVLLILYMVHIVVYSNWEKNLRWVAAGIVGGGAGNMIDRFIRVEGVVDFISVKFYGIFGFLRWPTFNIADISIVISMFFWVTFILFPNFLSKEARVVDDEQSESSE